MFCTNFKLEVQFNILCFQSLDFSLRAMYTFFIPKIESILQLVICQKPRRDTKITFSEYVEVYIAHLLFHAPSLNVNEYCSLIHDWYEANIPLIAYIFITQPLNSQLIYYYKFRRHIKAIMHSYFVFMFYLCAVGRFIEPLRH